MQLFRPRPSLYGSSISRFQLHLCIPLHGKIHAAFIDDRCASEQYLCQSARLSWPPSVPAAVAAHGVSVGLRVCM